MCGWGSARNGRPISGPASASSGARPALHWVVLARASWSARTAGPPRPGAALAFDRVRGRRAADRAGSRRRRLARPNRGCMDQPAGTRRTVRRAGACWAGPGRGWPVRPVGRRRRAVPAHGAMLTRRGADLSGTVARKWWATQPGMYSGRAWRPAAGLVQPDDWRGGLKGRSSTSIASSVHRSTAGSVLGARY